LQLARQSQSDGGPLIGAAVELGFVNEEDALRTVGEEFGLEFLDFNDAEIDLSLLKSFPFKLIYRQSLFLLRRENGALDLPACGPSLSQILNVARPAEGGATIFVQERAPFVASFRASDCGEWKS